MFSLVFYFASIKYWLMHNTWVYIITLLQEVILDHQPVLIKKQLIITFLFLEHLKLLFRLHTILKVPKISLLYVVMVFLHKVSCTLVAVAAVLFTNII